MKKVVALVLMVAVLAGVAVALEAGDGCIVERVGDAACVLPETTEKSWPVRPDVLVIYPDEPDQRCLFRLWLEGPVDEATFAVDSVRCRFRPEKVGDRALIRIGKGSIDFLTALCAAEDTPRLRTTWDGGYRDYDINEDLMDAVRALYARFQALGGDTEAQLAQVGETPMETY